MFYVECEKKIVERGESALRGNIKNVHAYIL